MTTYSASGTSIPSPDEAALNVLAALEISLVEADVWSTSPSFVDGLQQPALSELNARMELAQSSEGPSPQGVILRGASGTGKTHLLGWIREQIQERDGFFFSVLPGHPSNLWHQTVLALLDGFTRIGRTRESQLQRLLDRLCSDAGVSSNVRAAIVGEQSLTPAVVESFSELVHAHYPAVEPQGLNILKALTLYASREVSAQDMALSYLTLDGETEPGLLQFWGITPAPRSSTAIAREIFALMGLAGPSVIAVDHLDTAIAAEGINPDAQGWLESNGLEQITNWLNALSEITRRCITVVACLPNSWELVRLSALRPVFDRFTSFPPLGRIPAPAYAHELVRKILGYQFAQIGFTPPYDTWPVRPEVFEDAPLLTPRQLLKKIDAHLRSCVSSGVVQELISLADDPVAGIHSHGEDTEALAALDARFTQLLSDADIFSALDASTEDQTVPRLLYAGLRAWITEETQNAGFAVDPPSVAPGLHARLRLTVDEEREEQIHWSFRAIGSTNHLAALTRAKTAAVLAGLGAGVPERKLFLLRNARWPMGEKTAQTLAELAASGAIILHIGSDDLRTLSALETLYAEGHSGYQAWLKLRQPSHRTSIFRTALSDAANDNKGKASIA